MKRMLLACLMMLYCLPVQAVDTVALTARASNGDALAALELGRYYYLEKKNHKEAEKWLNVAAEENNAEAQYYLARIYDASREGKHPNKEIVAVLEQSAGAGWTEAQVYLARIYQFGRKGIRRDLKKAQMWYNLAAAKGSQEALKQLEIIYQSSKDGYIKAVNKDDDVAWLDKAVEQGNAEAALRLGEMALKGDRIPQDFSRAARLFTIAADAGIVQAQAELGVLYAEGKGVPQNQEKAISYLKEAAQQGYVEAQRVLAKLYAKELNNLPNAYAWQVISLSAMFPNASNLAEVSPDLERLLRAMTPEQLKEGQKVASRLVLIVKKNKKIQEQKQARQIKMMEAYEKNLKD